MNGGKKNKRELELDSKEIETEQESSFEEVPKVKPLMSFDAYFSKLVHTKGMMLHHKAPMRNYAEAQGLKDLATEAEFDSVFERY